MRLKHSMGFASCVTLFQTASLLQGLEEARENYGIRGKTAVKSL